MSKKHLSQNFLVDLNIKKKIIKEIDIKKNDIIVEIGPGYGSISKHLLFISKKLFLIEIDGDIIPQLKTVLPCDRKIKLYNDNILKFDFTNIITDKQKIRIIGNIPYKISTKLILHLSKFKNYIEDIHFLIQEEVSEKLIHECKNHNSSASMLIQYHFNVEKKFKVHANSFIPKPTVNSSFVRLLPKNNLKCVLNYQHFKHTVNHILKRKKQIVSKSIKNACRYKKYINLEAKGFEMRSHEYVRLSNLMYITNDRLED